MSGNSSKKKQEEKHMKTLREFLAMPANKTCFDCNQRGPTYVNATIGSFVCISCSGKLRGLTPPHRVKSISMASFSPEEIEFMRSRGNEYCRLVWMAHYNQTELGSEIKDEQKFKDHLVAKYEKKRWYADPGSIQMDRLPSIAKPQEVHASNHSEAKPNPVTHSPVARPAANQSSPATQKSAELLADLDFFSTGPTDATTFSPLRTRNHSSLPNSISQPSFANFQNADFFFPEFSPQKANVAQPTLAQQQQQQNQPSPQAVNGSHVSPPKETQNSNVPPVDRYSALKDLDALFTQNVEPAVTASSAAVTTSSTNDGSSGGWTPAWNPSSVASALPNKSESAFSSRMEAPSAWNAAFSPPTSNPTNPFLVNTSLQSSAPTANCERPALPWANFSTSPANGAAGGLNGALGMFSTSTSNHFGFINHHPNPPMGVTGLTSSQSLDLSPKTWGNSTALNPFTDSAAFAAQGRSHNPFL